MTTATLGPLRGDTVIDYEAPEGIKTYKRATTALKDEYDGKLDGISVFKMQLMNKAKAEGWSNESTSNVINIPKDGANARNGTFNIIKEHTQLSKDTIDQWANSTILSGTINRQAQNNKNMNVCIIGTLTKEFLSEIDLKEASYTRNRIIVAPLLVKIILEKAEMDTKVTSAIIRTELQQLDTKMVELNNNVHTFVEFVEG